MATRTISASGGTRAYSDNATWDEGLAPTASDDVVARGDGTSGPVTIGAAAACRSADFTNYSNTLTHNSFNWSIGTSTTNGSLGLKFVTGMTYTAAGTSAQLAFVSTSGTQTTVTLAGKITGNISFSGLAGSWQLQDTVNATISTGAQFFQSRGTLDLNGQTINCANFVGSGSNARTMTMNGATVNASLASGSAVDFTTTTLLTFSGATSVWNVTGATATFAGGGLTFGTVNLTGTGVATVTGANTYTTFTRSNAAACTLTLPASATQTVTNLTLQGAGPALLLTLNSSSSGTAATISVASGRVYGRFLSIKDSTVTGGATFQAIGSTLVSGDTGWTTFTFFGGCLNDQMVSSLRAIYVLPTAALNDLITKFETDNSLKGQSSWMTFYGGSGAFNDRAYAYWSTH